MNSPSWIAIGLGILLLMVIIFFAYVLFVSKKRGPPNYYKLFILGIVWIAIGIPIKNNILTILGIALTLIGLLNKKKWKKNRKKHLWKNLTKKEKIVNILMLIFLIILIIGGLILLYLNNKNLI